MYLGYVYFTVVLHRLLFYILDGSFATGCDITPFAFSTPPVVFNSSLIPQHSITDHTIPEDQQQANQEVTSVQSRGTSPMLPASDSCPEDVVDIKSDDNTEDIVEICEVDVKHENADAEKENINNASEIKTDSSDATKVNGSDMSPNGSIGKEVSNFVSEEKIKEKVAFCHSLNLERTNEINGSRQNGTSKQSKTNRNIFKDLTEYDPFLDPQVLQAADGLELLSALAEKSAPVIKVNDSSTKLEKGGASEVTDIKENILSQDEEREKTETLKTEKVELNDDSLAPKKKSRVKSGYPLKTKMEVKPAIADEKKMTTFCGITIPEGDTSFSFPLYSSVCKFNGRYLYVKCSFR